MSEPEFLDYPEAGEGFAETFRREVQIESRSRAMAWDLLFQAASSAESWAGIIAAANLVLKEKGRDPEAMERFFIELLTGAGDDWHRVIEAASEALNTSPDKVLKAVHSVVRSVPVVAFRTLVNLDRITYCWITYRDNPEKLRECLANL